MRCELYVLFVVFSACLSACRLESDVSIYPDSEDNGMESPANDADEGGTIRKESSLDANLSSEVSDTGSNVVGGTSGSNTDQIGGMVAVSGTGSIGNGETKRDDLIGFSPRNAISVSPRPRPRCPETPPVEGTTCKDTSGTLVCGYGIDTCPECRDVFHCGSDGTWHSAPESEYPCAEPRENVCPEVPTPDQPCSHVIEETNIDGILCEYEGFVICDCSNPCPLWDDYKFSWYCYGPPSDYRCPPMMPNFGEGCNIDNLECSYGDSCSSGQKVECLGGEWQGLFFSCDCI